MKNIWVIANLKSNETIEEVLNWVSEVGSKLEKKEHLKVVVCPTFTALEEVKKAVLVGNFPLLVGSQDLSPFDEGAYTGEEAASLLKQFVDLAILGHSERRQNFSETDEMVAKKVEQAIEHQIIPLVCVQSETTPLSEKVRLVAYEPIFAVGTGIADTPEDANRVASTIKQNHPDVEILYGGSVTADNVKGFVTKENINGVLVGKASLNPEEFVKIINTCSNL
jgi:triosephosphate isomerase (TIM)